MDKKISLDIPIEETNDAGYICRLVDKILETGINARASDIHLDPQSPQMCLRFRIDGAIYDVAAIPKSIEESLVSRIKSMADMDITERRKPQDGRICLRFNKRDYNLGVGSASTISGERVLVKIWDKNRVILDVDDLGLSAKNKGTFLSFIIKPSGMILVTGPKESGKTSTLYAALNKINNLGKNIATIEDLVEYQLKGVNQTQLNAKAEISFATGLRAILKQDPDIIMVGEIVDLETASIAVNAALRGHLVFSTMHTNDAASAISRLIDMGLEPFLLSSALLGVVAQRLVRTLCPECKEQYTPERETVQEFGLECLHIDRRFFRGKGCPYCMHTGYYGRTGIFEVMPISDKMRDLILKKQLPAEIRRLAASEGQFSLKEAAIEKIILGLTTLEEIKRTIFTTEE